MISGLLVFVMGCLGCYASPSVHILMVSRLVQAFGGSIGSVLTQAVCRDAFHGPALGRAYAATGSALALFPTLGPLCGGLIAELFGWRNIFIVLIGFGLTLTYCVSKWLPETHPHASRKQISIWEVAKQLIRDKKVLGFGLIVAGCNGILFSYFAEGAFYLIEGLGLTPRYYGLSFTVIGGAAMLGGLVSKKLQNKHTAKEIMDYGLLLIAFVTTIFSCIALMNHHLFPLAPQALIAITILSQMGCAFGICMATSNALALALVDYKHAIGTASSLFGFFYYALISLFTFFMGLLHDGTLLPMPLYFLVLSCFMLIVRCVYLKHVL